MQPLIAAQICAPYGRRIIFASSLILERHTDARKGVLDEAGGPSTIVCSNCERHSMSANIADSMWHIIFVSSTSFIFWFIPYIIPWYASDVALMSCFGSYCHFPEGGFLVSEMLMALPVTVGTAPWGVSRTLAYCAVSSSFGRCLRYPVRSVEDRVPLMVPDHSDISS